MSDASISYDASAVNLSGLHPNEIRQMNRELQEFMDGLFERYGLIVENERSEMDAGTRQVGGGITIYE